MTHTNRPYTLLRKITVALAATVAALALAEIGLRIFDVGKPEWNFYYPRFYLSDDPVLGFFPTPSFSTTWKKIRLSNNSLGFRDMEHPFEKTIGAVRILGLGDSQTWGANINVESTYLRQLAGIAGRSKNSPRVEVIVAGVPGYASDQEVELLRIQGPRLKPDVVIMALFLDYQYGDLPRLVAHQKFGFYRVYDGYSIPAEMAEKIKAGGINGWLTKIKIALQANSHVVSLLYRHVTNPPFSRCFYVPLQGADRNVSAVAIQCLSGNLKRFKSLCQALHAKPLLLLIPSLAHYLRPDSSLEFFNGQILKTANELKLPVLDLHPRFYRSLADNRPLYFPDNHLSPVGHEVVAEELVKFMKGQNKIEGMK